VDHPADGIDPDEHGQVVKYRDQYRALQGELDRITGAELPAELRRPDETGEGRDGREDQNMNGVALAYGAFIIANRFPFAFRIHEQAPHMF
jgi:hypothetical protein